MSKYLLYCITLGFFLVCITPYIGWTENETASAVGAVELDLLEAIFTGNIGLTLGVALTAVAIWRIFVNGDIGGGVTLLVIAVAITILPGVYNGLMDIVCSVVITLGAACGGS